ncbi:MAG: hypothetical protein AAGE99_02855 [Chlamydiota bacterium]
MTIGIAGKGKNHDDRVAADPAIVKAVQKERAEVFVQKGMGRKTDFEVGGDARGAVTITPDPKRFILGTFPYRFHDPEEVLKSL